MPRQWLYLLPADWVGELTPTSDRIQEGLLKPMAALDDPPRLPLTSIPNYYVGAIPVGPLRAAQVPLEIKQLRRQAVVRSQGPP
jgi:hypothetical protein